MRRRTLGGGCARGDGKITAWLCVTPTRKRVIRTTVRTCHTCQKGYVGAAVGGGICEPCREKEVEAQWQARRAQLPPKVIPSAWEERRAPMKKTKECMVCKQQRPLVNFTAKYGERELSTICSMSCRERFKAMTGARA
jgi:hypothetical protein